jgi:hypothetical protein
MNREDVMYLLVQVMEFTDVLCRALASWREPYGSFFRDHIQVYEMYRDRTAYDVRFRHLTDAKKSLQLMMHQHSMLVTFWRSLLRNQKPRMSLRALYHSPRYLRTPRDIALLENRPRLPIVPYHGGMASLPKRPVLQEN